MEIKEVDRIVSKALEDKNYHYYIDIKEQKPIIKCPTCGSENTSKLTTIDRGVSLFAFGLASGSVGKQFVCNKCKYKW